MTRPVTCPSFRKSVHTLDSVTLQLFEKEKELTEEVKEVEKKWKEKKRKKILLLFSILEVPSIERYYTIH